MSESSNSATEQNSLQPDITDIDAVAVNDVPVVTVSDSTVGAITLAALNSHPANSFSHCHSNHLRRTVYSVHKALVHAQMKLYSVEKRLLMLEEYNMLLRAQLQVGSRVRKS